jgi:hypothetical protein
MAEIKSPRAHMTAYGSCKQSEKFTGMNGEKRLSDPSRP